MQEVQPRGVRRVRPYHCHYSVAMDMTVQVVETVDLVLYQGRVVVILMGTDNPGEVIQGLENSPPEGVGGDFLAAFGEVPQWKGDN